MSPTRPRTEPVQHRALIRGRVQGVGFRYFVQREALAAGLVGWVRNLAGGDVEAVYQGSPEAVQRFETRLWDGPALARVESVALETRSPDPSLLSFEVRPSSW